MKTALGLAITFLVLAVPGVAVADGSTGPPPTGATATSPDNTARLLELVNRERAATGAPTLVLRSDLSGIAGDFSQRMAEQGRIWHNDDYFTIATMERLGARLVGENVAINSSIDGAHEALMESPRHRANILDADFTLVGIGVAQNADGFLFVTQDFLAPREPDAGHAASKPAATPGPTPDAAPATAPSAGSGAAASPAAAPGSARTGPTAPPAARPVAAASSPTSPTPPAQGEPAAALAPHAPPVPAPPAATDPDAPEAVDHGQQPAPPRDTPGSNGPFSGVAAGVGGGSALATLARRLRRRAAS
jgi:uncharacterized protein YkwD